MTVERHRTTSEHFVEAFRALSDPLRLQVMSRIAVSDEVACTSLETSLPVSKSTISYHMKVLYHAGLINIRKEGRNYFYAARREAIDEELPGLWDWLLRAAQDTSVGRG